MDAALEAGLTAFDHADIYCRGKSETVFGLALKQRPALRDHIFLQSKCGIRFANDPSRSRAADFSRNAHPGQRGRQPAPAADRPAGRAAAAPA
ncbi:MAG: aldo/keto reductase [Kiritimatiellia bacterium]